MSTGLFEIIGIKDPPQRVEFAFGDEREVIEMDVTSVEDHQLAINVTDFPIETGANITDHIRVTPELVRIEALISDTTRSIVEAIDNFGKEDNRSGVVWDRIRDFAKAGTLCDIRTPKRFYESMLVTRVSVPRKTEFTKGLVFEIEAQTVQFASTETGEALLVPETPKVDEPPKAPKTDGGRKQMVPAAPEQARSVAAHVVDGVGRAIGP